MNKIVALVGMPGSGKTEAVQMLTKAGYQYLRFGQVVIDEAMSHGPLTPESEKIARKFIRDKYGMAAMAILNIPKVEELLKNGNVVIDGLYSWEEYKVLKDRYGENIIVLAIVAGPKTRYSRLSGRKLDLKKDPKAINHEFTPAQAKDRDIDQIENANQGGPIAMADYFVVNEKSKKHLINQLTNLLIRSKWRQRKVIDTQLN